MFLEVDGEEERSIPAFDRANPRARLFPQVAIGDIHFLPQSSGYEAPDAIPDVADVIRLSLDYVSLFSDGLIDGFQALVLKIFKMLGVWSARNGQIPGVEGCNRVDPMHDLTSGGEQVNLVITLFTDDIQLVQ